MIELKKMIELWNIRKKYKLYNKRKTQIMLKEKKKKRKNVGLLAIDS